MNQSPIPLYREPKKPDYGRRMVNKNFMLHSSLRSMDGMTIEAVMDNLKRAAQEVGYQARLDFLYDPDEARDTSLYLAYTAMETDLEYQSRIRREEELWNRWHSPEYQKKFKALENAQKKAQELKRELGMN